MKLKNQFLRLFALLGLSMAATSAWADDNVDPVVNYSNGRYSVNMPKPTGQYTIATGSWTVPEGVQSFKVYDDGGANAPFTSTKCGGLYGTNGAIDDRCAEKLLLTAPQGYFLHLSGSLTSNADSTAGGGAKAYFYVYKGTTASSQNALIGATGSASSLQAWSENQNMLLQFYSAQQTGTNGAGLDLTIEVAMDLGNGGPGSYTFPASVDYLELHASVTNESVSKTTTLTAPAGSFIYLTFNDTLVSGDRITVYDGENSNSSVLLDVTEGVNNDTVYSSSNKLTIVLTSDEGGLNKIVRAVAYVVKKNTSLSTTGIDIYNNEAANYAVAKIGDPQSGKVSIPNAISVNAIEYDRVFTQGTPSTIVLPFSLPSGATTNAKFYTLRKVVQVENECKWKATMKWIGDGVLPSANTPYAVIVPSGTELTFNLNGGQASFQTGTIADQTDSTGNWIFKGTYQYIAWTAADYADGLLYGFAGTDETGITRGKFGKVGEGSTAAPMRAYMSKAGSEVRLQPIGNAHPMARSVSSIDLPESIDVEFVDDADKPMAIGRMNTVTGAIKIDRWFDLKGRSTNHKPTTKGAFFNKKGIAK